MSKHHVTCKHPRASDNINGVSFKKHGEHKRTVEPVEWDVAKQFDGCADFEVSAPVGEKPPRTPRTPRTPRVAPAAETTPATDATNGDEGDETGDHGSDEGDGGDATETGEPAAADETDNTLGF